MSIEISLPFRFDTTGQVATQTDPIIQVADHIRALIGTLFGERIMLPDFGTHAWELVFEPQSLVEAQLTEELRLAIAKFEDRAELLSLTARQTTLHEADAGVEFKVSYRLVGIEDVKETTINLGTGVVPGGLTRSL